MLPDTRDGDGGGPDILRRLHQRQRWRYRKRIGIGLATSGLIVDAADNETHPIIIDKRDGRRKLLDACGLEETRDA